MKLPKTIGFRRYRNRMARQQPSTPKGPQPNSTKTVWNNYWQYLMAEERKK